MYEDYIAERLSFLRGQKKVSARAMSLDLGQNENYINHIESKKYLPSMQVFFYICEYLEITPEDFFCQENSAPLLVKTLTSNLCHLTERQLVNINEIVEDLTKTK